MTAPVEHGCTIRATRRLTNGDVEVTAVTPGLHLLVVVVPFERSGAEDIDRALSLGMEGTREVLRHP